MQKNKPLILLFRKKKLENNLLFYLIFVCIYNKLEGGDQVSINCRPLASINKPA